MALSYYSNYLIPQIQTELNSELLNFNNNFTFSETCIDPLFEHQPESFLFENYQNALLPPSNHLDPVPPELDPFFYPNCHYNPNFLPDLYNGFFPNPNPLPLPDMSPEIFGPLPELVPEMSPEVVGPVGYDWGGKKQNVSAQSIAARQRRRKISEKTQELGKLIPGGQKMNTAEMLQAAYKYVKFLQAQVGFLEIMGAIQENEEPIKNKELQVLVTSTLIQEKLYSQEKCLVPKEFVKTLANDLHLQSNPLIHKEINQFIQSTDK